MHTQVHSCSDTSMPQHWQCLRRVICFRQGKIFFVGQCCKTILSDNKIWQREFQLLNPSAPHLTVWIFFLGSYDLKYVWRRTLCVCINKWKFREITSFPEINEVIYTERHFIAENKTHHKTRHLHTTKVYNTQPSQFCSLKSNFFFLPLSSVHLFQSNQCFEAIEFMDPHISENL